MRFIIFRRERLLLGSLDCSAACFNEFIDELNEYYDSNHMGSILSVDGSCFYRIWNEASVCFSISMINIYIVSCVRESYIVIAIVNFQMTCRPCRIKVIIIISILLFGCTICCNCKMVMCSFVLWSGSVACCLCRL